MSDAAVKVTRYARRARIKYPRRTPIEFCPWIRTETLETHVLINDLAHTLARNHRPVSRSWQSRLGAWADMERVVDQYSADGTLLQRFSKRLATDEIWRLSLGLAEQPSLEYGMLVFSGSPTLCHFQVVGPCTFATCHGRRFPLLEPVHKHNRGISLVRQPRFELSLFLMNRGEGTNEITLSRPLGTRSFERVTVALAPFGCRIVSLTALFQSSDEVRPHERISMTSTHPYDFYTLIENGSSSAETFSMQHIK